MTKAPTPAIQALDGKELGGRTLKVNEPRTNPAPAAAAAAVPVAAAATAAAAAVVVSPS